MSLTKEQDKLRQKSRRDSMALVKQLAINAGYTKREGESVYGMIIRYCKDKKNGVSLLKSDSEVK